jgi:hypothetical protein
MCPFGTPKLDSNRRLNPLPPGMAGGLFFRHRLGISFRGPTAPQFAIPRLDLLKFDFPKFDLLKFVLCGPPPGFPKSYGCDGVEEW